MKILNTPNILMNFFNVSIKIFFGAAMEELKQRLIDFITNHLGISIRRFEESCGLPFSTVASIKVKGPGADALLKISNTYPEMNMNWLIAGRGPMLMSDQPQPSEQPKIELHHNNTVNIGNWGELVELVKSLK